MGLARRRYFATRGRQLLGIEDELFGEHALDLGEGAGLQGQGALIAALETARSGRMGDIVATIQGEQDEIIRAPLPGVLVVQGGPGTGKTVVALHRAAYLLYTHRFPLEDQGVLVVGPNRLFLAYIEQVLPSLGEAGVELAVLADLVDGVNVRGRDREAVARLKGHEVMAKVLAKAVRDRKRALRRPLRVGHGLQTLTPAGRRVGRHRADARRRYRLHNAGRRFVERGGGRPPGRLRPHPARPPGAVAPDPPHTPRCAPRSSEMWPVLTPAELLHDLFGSRALLRSAGGRHLATTTSSPASAARRVGARRGVDPRRRAAARRGPRAARPPPQAAQRRDDDEIRTYGHIVIDEAQDLSPMQLRHDQPPLAERLADGGGRHRPVHRGVGATPTGTRSWPCCPSVARPPRAAHGRLPHPGAEHGPGRPGAAHAAPDLTPPRSVRQDGRPPGAHAGRPRRGAGPAVVVRAVQDEIAAVGTGNVAVICPASRVEVCSQALTAVGIEHGVAIEQGLSHQVTVVPVGIVKGLELDATVVVDPRASSTRRPRAPGRSTWRSPGPPSCSRWCTPASCPRSSPR
jgi:hypothetical protein